MTVRRKRCSNCGVLFSPETTGEKLCFECRKLKRLRRCKDITLVERQRHLYNARNNTGLTYGQFILMLESI